MTVKGEGEAHRSLSAKSDSSVASSMSPVYASIWLGLGSGLGLGLGLGLARAAPATEDAWWTQPQEAPACCGTVCLLALAACYP